jgi:hypothetical protein
MAHVRIRLARPTDSRALADLRYRFRAENELQWKPNLDFCADVRRG